MPFFIPFNYASITKYKKGCSFWNRFLRRGKTTNIRNLEQKNANSLGIVIDDQRWKQIYWMVSNIKYGNDIKWFVHQILRGCLTTNYVLKKMKIRNFEHCTFCRLGTEKIRHLFWDCRIVSSFLVSVKDELDRICPGYDLGFTPNNHYGREVFILGDNRPGTGLGPNYLYNLVKKFVWNVRCRAEEGAALPPSLGQRDFWRFLDQRLKEDRFLARRIPELRFVEDLVARRGIG